MPEEIISSEQIEERKARAKKYLERFQKADKAPGFNNCAGLVKFIIGLSDKDGFVKPNSSSKDGLLAYLNMIDRLPVNDFSDEKWLEKSRQAIVAAFLHRGQNDKWEILHYCVPNPDPGKPFEVYHRNGFFEVDAEIGDIREVIKDETYSKDSYLVFYELKKPNIRD